MANDEFYHGVDRYHIANEELPEYKGVDTLMLYTLTTGSTSQFKDLQLCIERCNGGE